MKKPYNQILKELREDNDLSQEEVADALSIRQQVYSRYEIGIRSLPIEHLIKLAKYYKVTTDYILGMDKY